MTNRLPPQPNPSPSMDPDDLDPVALAFMRERLSTDLATHAHVSKLHDVSAEAWTQKAIVVVADASIALRRLVGPSIAPILQVLARETADLIALTVHRVWGLTCLVEREETNATIVFAFTVVRDASGAPEGQ